nr:DUF2652 domain-containing protein [Microbacterium lemovicicum]
MTTSRTTLLIADIGGYTDYMGSHRLTLAHAEVNTARMLDSVIDAARGFDLVEIEGDAAFLSRRAGDRDAGAVLAEVLQAAAQMHRAFHREREYVVANLCPCGGCRQARALTLKFVAHVGDVAIQSIRGRSKLVGIDVILAHRLLKNDVTIPEYVLITDDLYSEVAGSRPEGVQELTQEVEGIGQVLTHIVDVGELDQGSDPGRPTLATRLSSTFSAIGRGLPYMIGARGMRVQR